MSSENCERPDDAIELLVSQLSVKRQRHRAIEGSGRARELALVAICSEAMDRVRLPAVRVSLVVRGQIDALELAQPLRVPLRDRAPGCQELLQAPQLRNP